MRRRCVRRSLHRLAICAALGLFVFASAGPLRSEESVLNQLQTQFNKDHGVLRLVILVSPTCPECVGGAGWIQDYILKRYPKLPLKVYAVWFEMYPGDSPADYPAAQRLMRDRRVMHWWDQNKDVGRWFTDVVPTNLKGDIQWDAFYLYGAEAIWGDQPPSPLLTWGRTILVNRKRLSEKIAEIAGPPTVPVINLPGAPPAP
jgi:hypothetical protein